MAEGQAPPCIHRLSGDPGESAQGAAGALQSLLSDGATLVACRGSTPEQWAASVVSLLQPLARQIRVFASKRDWRTMGVDLDKAPDRSEGTGASPLHIDFVNAAHPPDYIALICVRNDPLGGGESTLSAIADAIANLSIEERLHLEQPIFTDGKVDNLDNVGVDINPFAVIANAAPLKYRYTGQLLKGEYPPPVTLALRHLQSQLEARQVCFVIRPGHALIVNQHRHVHGKRPLGEPQFNVSPNSRRLLLHGFFRSL